MRSLAIELAGDRHDRTARVVTIERLVIVTIERLVIVTIERLVIATNRTARSNGSIEARSNGSIERLDRTARSIEIRASIERASK